MKKFFLIGLLISSHLTLFPTVSVVIHRPSYYARPFYYSSPLFFSYYPQTDAERFIMSMCTVLNCCFSDSAFLNKDELKFRFLLAGTTLMLIGGVYLGVALMQDTNVQHNQ